MSWLESEEGTKWSDLYHAPISPSWFSVKDDEDEYVMMIDWRVWDATKSIAC